MSNVRHGRSMVLSALAKISSIGAATLLTKLQSASLGPVGYGQLASAIALVAVFSIMTDIGTGAVTPREIALQPDRAPSIIGVNLGLRTILTTTAIVIANGIAWAAYGSGIAVLVPIISLSLAFQTFQDVLCAYLVAKVRGHVVASIALVQQLFSVGAAALVWWIFGPSPTLFAIVYSVAAGLSALLVLLAVPRSVRVWPRFHRRHMVRTLRMSATVGITQMIDVVYLRADTLILAGMAGAASAAEYTVCTSIVVVAGTIPGIVMATFGTSVVQSDPSDVAKIVRRAGHITGLAATALAMMVIPDAHDVITIISSTAYSRAAGPLTILMVASVVWSLQYVLGWSCVGRSVNRPLVWVSLSCMLANIGLNVLLIPLIGVYGTAWASLGTSLVSFVATSYVFARGTGSAARLETHVLPILAAGASGASVGYVVNISVGRLNAVLSLAFTDLVAGVAFVAVFLLLRIGAVRDVARDKRRFLDTLVYGDA